MKSMVDAADRKCLLTRGCWRRTLCVSLLLNLGCTVGLLLSFINSEDAGLQAVNGYFCVHDTTLCPVSEFDLHPTLESRPSNPVCMNPTALAASSSTSTSSSPLTSTSSSTSSSNATSSSPCFDIRTKECIQARGLGQALQLINSVLHDGTMRLLNRPSTRRWSYVGVGFLILHTFAFLVLETPLTCTSYGWASRQVPERIFVETTSVICASWWLKLIILTFLTLTVWTGYTFPSDATCEEINLLPSVEDISATVGSRKQFMADCTSLHEICHLHLQGISATWDSSDHASLTNFLIGIFFFRFNILFNLHLGNYCRNQGVKFFLIKN